VESLFERGAVSYRDPITVEEVDVTEDGSNELPGTVLTIDWALEEMVTYSDNGAALALVRRYGAHETNVALMAAGIRGFHIAEDRDEDNVVTARALGEFFALLATRRLISAGASDRMLVRLERQQINDRLPRELPADVQVAHKTGDLIGLVHDAGLIQTRDGPRIAVVLTSGGTEATAKDLIAHVGLAVYSAVLAAAPGARLDPLPFQALTRTPSLSAARGGGLPVAAAVAIVLVAFAGLVLVRRARRPRRRGRRRRSGPMAVWSPDRTHRTDRTALR
jgi:beta-lactamase class A